MRMDYESVLSSVNAIVDETVMILDSFGKCLASTDERAVGKTYNVPGDLDTLKSSSGSLYLNISHAFDSPILKVEHKSDESVKVIRLIQLMIVNKYVKKGKEDYLLKSLAGPLSEEDIQYVNENSFYTFYKNDYRITTFDLSDIKSDAMVFIAKQLFEDQVVTLFSKQLVVISNQSFEALNSMVSMFLSEVESEIMTSIKASIGKVCSGLENVHIAYQSSLRTYDLGRLLHEDKNVLYYEQLIIPFMIDAVDKEVVAELINPIEDAMDSVFEDEELVMTMTQFFLNDLNITVTARNLFVHRNTLIYRLSKIEKLTGMDLKKFEDAVKLYLILYIKKISK